MKLVFFLLSLTGIISCASSIKELNLVWPADKKQISRHFSTTHDGMDIALPKGSTIYAAHDGTVLDAIYSSTYGKMILIEKNKWATLYAHLSQFSVSKGAKVSAGQKIGLSGSTGISYGPHLHFELIKNKKPINPFPYLPK